MSMNLRTHLCLKCHLYAGILKYSKSKANTLNGNLIVTMIFLIECISGKKQVDGKIIDHQHSVISFFEV